MAAQHTPDILITAMDTDGSVSEYRASRASFSAADAAPFLTLTPGTLTCIRLGALPLAEVFPLITIEAGDSDDVVELAGDAGFEPDADWDSYENAPDGDAVVHRAGVLFADGKKFFIAGIEASDGSVVPVLARADEYFNDDTPLWSPEPVVRYFWTSDGDDDAPISWDGGCELTLLGGYLVTHGWGDVEVEYAADLLPADGRVAALVGDWILLQSTQSLAAFGLEPVLWDPALPATAELTGLLARFTFATLTLNITDDEKAALREHLADANAEYRLVRDILADPNHALVPAFMAALTKSVRFGSVEPFLTGSDLLEELSQ